MIALALGKKGSDKTAIVRRIVGRALAQRRAIFCHDPQCQYDQSHGRVYETAKQWQSDPAPTLLSIFRGCEVEEVAALALRVGDVTIALDEMDRGFINKRWDSPSLRRAVHEGRHYRVGLLGTFRRTANVSEDLLSQADYVFLFRHSISSPYDLRTIEQRFGDQYAHAVQRLDFGQFVVWQDA